VKVPSKEALSGPLDAAILESMLLWVGSITSRSKALYLQRPPDGNMAEFCSDLELSIRSETGSVGSLKLEGENVFFCLYAEVY
jgi:hypothetical protein